MIKLFLKFNYYVVLLMEDINKLGFNLGFKYWQLRLKCAKDPQIALDWADSCEKEGNKFLIKGQTEEGFACLDFAESLRKSYSFFTGNYFYLGEKPIIPNMVQFLLQEGVLNAMDLEYYCPSSKKNEKTLSLLVCFKESADSESITAEEIHPLFKYFVDKGWDGVYKFVTEKRQTTNKQLKI